MDFIGIDPDTHNLAFAMVDEAGKVTDLKVFTVRPVKLAGRAALLQMTDILAKEIVRLLNIHLMAPGVEIEALTVEAQDIYQHGPYKTKNPKSMMFLATIAGAALVTFRPFASRSYFPTPQEWKGSVRKQIHQARVLTKLGWQFKRVGTVEKGYCVPLAEDVPAELREKITKGNWKHVVDAIGLALYARDKYLADTAREARAEAAKATISTNTKA